MRKLLFTSIFILTTFNLAAGQTLDKITTLEFTKQSRGFLDQLVISRDSIHGMVENHRATDQSKHYASDIDQDQWAELVLSLKDVSLADVDGLQSPTMNRAHDGAVHSTIVITLEDGQSVTHGFDDENPHPDLKPLLDAMLEFKVSSK